MKLLCKEKVKSYRDNGFIWPIAVFTESEIEDYRTRLGQGPLDPPGLCVGQKLYLLRTWAPDY